jgi:enoyl-CoA hydratase/carnithine racemase
MVLMGEFLDAAEALRVGLVHEVVPAAGLATRVDQIARALTEKPSTSMSLTKRWLRELGDAAFGLASLRARDIHAESYAAGDFTAGAKNFLKHKAE